MKKLAIGALCLGTLALAGALATSYYVGGRIEQAILETAESWTAGGGVTVQVLDYERGIITSRAQTLWTIAAEEDTYEITAVHDIVQGPWPMGKAARVVSQFMLPEGSDPALVRALSGQAPLQWTAVADWSGATDNQMHSPGFKAEFEDGSTLSWEGIQMEWTLSAAMDATQGWMRMPALKVEEADGSRMDLEQMELKFDVQIPQGYSFWVGPSDMKIHRVAAYDAAQDTSVDMQGIRMHSRNQLHESLLQTDLEIRLEQFDNDSFKIHDLLLQLQARNIEAQWFGHWLQWLQNGGAVQEQEVQLLETLPELLAGKPELRIHRLSMRSSDGPVALNAYLRYDGKQPQAFDPGADLQGQLELSMPAPLLRRFMDSRVRADYVELLEQMEQQLDEPQMQASIDEGVSKRLQTLLGSRVLLQDGDTLRLKLRFADGRFVLNGQPQSLQDLLSILGLL